MLSSCIRLDPYRIHVENPQHVPTTIFANDAVFLEKTAVMELLELLELETTIARVAEQCSGTAAQSAHIEHVCVTPDFHKGLGIPIGTVLVTEGCVVPQAIGNDVNCGMRLQTTSLTVDQILAKKSALEGICRHVFFEGGRNIPMTRQQREGLFREGLVGLLNTSPRSLQDGLWSLFHARHVDQELDRIDSYGGLFTTSIQGLEDFVGTTDVLSRDSQIGSIGGGNHFVEIQYVHRIIDGPTAYAWGLRQGMVMVLIHTGSVSIGSIFGSQQRTQALRMFPSSLPFPSNRILPIILTASHERQVASFWDMLANATNFAFANRLFLSLMIEHVFQQIFGEVALSLVYDAPHNMVWPVERDGHTYYVHRKGACYAQGPTDHDYYGEPVFVPGSMGSSSYVMAGQGHRESWESASHGAGRAISRGTTLHGHNVEFEEFLQQYTVVTPVDWRQQRKDIAQKLLLELKQESPFAYKDVVPVIETLQGAGMARPVAELKPLLTIKG